MNIMVLVVFGSMAGALCGLIPLTLGNRRQNTRLGQRGFVFCLVAGAISGVILALPVAAVFAWLICRRSSARDERAEMVVKEPVRHPRRPSLAGMFAGSRHSRQDVSNRTMGLG